MTFIAFFITTTRRIIHCKRAFGFVLAAVSCLVPQSFAQSATPAERMEALRNATSLDRAGLRPWHLKLSFTLNDFAGKQQDTGEAEVFWTAEHKQKTEIHSQLFGTDFFTSNKTTDLKALRERFLISELLKETIRPVESVPQTDFIATEQTRKFGKVDLNCLSFVRRSSTKVVATPLPEYCVEPQRPDVLRAIRGTVEGTLRNRLGTFQNTNVALDNTIVYGGLVAISGKTEILDFQKNEAASSGKDSSEDSGETRDVASARIPGGVIAGNKISGQTPEYPLVARMQHVSGSVVLQGIIDKTGHISRLVPIASPDSLLTQASISTVKTWTYRPYLLNNEPVEVDTTITVNFNLR